MNCTTVQRRLLAQAEPVEPSEAVHAHLQTCPHCQEWQKRLSQIDRHVAVLPVPRSSARAECIQRFRGDGTVWEKARFRIRNLQRWQLTAGALAASLLLFILAWSMAPTNSAQVVRPTKSSAPDLLLAKLMQRNLKLAIATTPKDQVQTLAGLAEDLRSHSQPLHVYGSGREGKESLRDLADWYGQVVRMGVTRAVKLPPEDVRPVLEPIVKQLSQATDDAEHLASLTTHISGDHPLFTIANAARNGKDHLERMLKQQEAAVPMPVPQRLPLLQERASRTEHVTVRSTFPLPLACLAVLPQARADNPSPGAIAADEAMRFQRNRALICALVQNCLRLTELTESVQRASSCMVIAEQLAEEMQRAATDNDIVRATELSKCLKDLLVQGIAFNLTTASGEIPAGAVGEAQMLQIGDHVQRITAPVEEKMTEIAAKDSPERWQRLGKQITDGRAEVHKALKGRGTY